MKQIEVKMLTFYLTFTFTLTFQLIYLADNKLNSNQFMWWRGTVKVESWAYLHKGYTRNPVSSNCALIVTCSLISRTFQRCFVSRDFTNHCPWCQIKDVTGTYICLILGFTGFLWGREQYRLVGDSCWLWRMFYINVVSNHSTSCVHLKIGGAGVKPWFYIEDGELRGSDPLMVDLLSKKLGFSYTLEFNAANFADVFSKVCSIKSSWDELSNSDFLSG